MPPITEAELQQAEQHLRSSSSARKRKRVTQPALVTEVARRRILRGVYGEFTPSQNRVSEAGDDLHLSERQKQVLRQQLREEAMPVRTLNSFFDRVASPDTAAQPAAQPVTKPAAQPAAHTQQSTRVTGPDLGVADAQLLVSAAWLREHMPTLIRTASIEGVTLGEYVGATSPPEALDSDDEQNGHVTRCLMVTYPAGHYSGKAVNEGMMTDEVIYSLPPSRGESPQSSALRQERHCAREEKVFRQLELRHWGNLTDEQRHVWHVQRQVVMRGRADPAQREIEVNVAAVTLLGLPALDVALASPSSLPAAPSLPAPLLDALASGLVLQARIVDFWSGSSVIRRAIRVWLESLGFDVTVTDDVSQIGAACGYVAARATGCMFAAGDEWRSVVVSGAVEEHWIALGNALLENGRTSDDYLETQDVYILAQMFYEHTFNLPHQPWDSTSQAFPSMEWPLRVGSLDWSAKNICEALMTYVARGHVVGDPERAFFVTNTQKSGEGGSHWISVALSMYY
jgi:hypothetical protein